jgi:hypothetical protein
MNRSACTGRRGSRVAARGAQIERMTMIMNRAAITLFALAAFSAINAHPSYAEIYRGV